MNNIFRKLRTSTVLNVIGLSIAFTAFIIIMIQVKYDLGFSKNIKDWDRIYRIEMVDHPSTPDVFSAHLSRPIIEALCSSSPNIEYYVTQIGWREGIFYRENNEPTSGIDLRSKGYSNDVSKVFGIELIIGNIEDFKEPNAAIISQTAAKRLFQNENPIGEIILDQRENKSKIIGIFKDYPRNSIIYSDIITNCGDIFLNLESEWSSYCFVKINSNENIESIEDELKKIIIEDEEPDTYKNVDKVIRLTNIHEVFFSKDIHYDTEEKGNKSTTWSLLVIAILIIGIAIINFLNFSMAMIPLRMRAINTKKILGCTVGSLRRNLILKDCLLAIISFGLALILVHIIAGTPFASLVSADLNLGANISILIASGFVALISGLIAAIYPSFYSTSFSPAFALKGSFGLNPKGRKLRSILISVQYIISVVLIIVAIFIKVQNDYMKDYDPGYQKENILTVNVGSTVAKQKNAFVQELKNHPTIIDVTFADGPILSNGKMGWGRDYQGEGIDFDCFPVDPNFLSFFDMRIVEGRDFQESDALKRNGTIIFNQKTVDTYGINVGDKINGHSGLGADIVGTVKNFNFQPLQYSINPIALYVMGSEPWRLQSFMFVKIGHGADNGVILTSEQIKSAIEHIRTTITKFNPKYTDANVEFMDEAMGNLYQKEDNLSKLILYACILSVLISIIGVLGLTLFETRYRRKEIGIRKVFGADIKSILLLFNLKYIKITLICCLIGSPIAYIILQKFLDNYAYATPIHIWVFLTAFAIIILITVLTITLETLRAANENPVDTME